MTWMICDTILDMSAYPTRGMRFLTAMGMVVPPMDEPTAVNPNARPRFFLNQWAIIALAGPYTPPQAI